MKKTSDIDDELNALFEKMKLLEDKNNHFLINITNTEIRELIEKRNKQRTYQERKAKEKKERTVGSGNSYYDYMYVKYTNLSVDELKIALRDDSYDRQIIRDVIESKKNNQEINDSLNKNNEFHDLCKRESTDDLNRMRCDEDLTDNEKNIIRAELRKRYGIT